MLHTRAMFFARAVRAFAATSKDKPFLSDAIAKAAIGKDMGVAFSFVSAFAPLVHQQAVKVTTVSVLPSTTGLSLGRDMKHDIALRYSVAGAGTAQATSALIEVVPQYYNRSLVEIQQRPEHYLPGRSLAHASGHYLAAVDEMAKMVKAERLKAKEEAKTKDESKTEADLTTSGQHAGKSSRRKSPSTVPAFETSSPVYAAYVHVEPVHLLMLSDFCYAHDTVHNVWRAPKSLSGPLAANYGWASPLFSTFRLTSEAASVRLGNGVEDPGLNSFASSLRDRLSITIVHLPMVPLALNDMSAWDKVVTLPEHRLALRSSAELREWLHYLAHTKMVDRTVVMPPELRERSVFRKSAEMAEEVVRAPGGFSYSEKEVEDFALQAKRDQEDAVRKGQEAAAVREAAALKKEREAAAAREEAALKKERVAAAVREEAALKKERVAAEAALKKEQEAAAVREATLLAEVERLKKTGSGSS